MLACPELRPHNESMSNKNARAAIYVRVSTRDGRQDTELQKADCQAYCDSQGWILSKVYEDRETGSKSDRPAFREMMRDAQQRRFDILVFWALDRFSREGVVQTQQHLARLDAAGVRFHSVKESYLDSCGLFREVVIALLAVLAKQERVRMSERIKAGIENCRREGKRVGRKPVEVDMNLFRIVVEKRPRPTARDIGRTFNISRSMVYVLMDRLEKENATSNA